MLLNHEVTNNKRIKVLYTFIDDFFKKIWIFIFKAKSKYLLRFKIKILCISNRGEYLLKHINEFLKIQGIRRKTSIFYI